MTKKKEVLGGFKAEGEEDVRKAVAKVRRNPYGPCCPECGYDGRAYHNGRYGWVDKKMPEGPACAKCSAPAREALR